MERNRFLSNYMYILFTPTWRTYADVASVVGESVDNDQPATAHKTLWETEPC